MARRARKKNKKLTMTYLKFIILGIFTLFIVFVIFNRTVYFLDHAKMFKIKEVVRGPSLQFIESRHLERLKGKSIFRVNLKTVQSQLQSQYPEIDRLRIVRKFPDQIHIIAKKREPFAYMSLADKDVLLDKEGYVLSVKASPDDKFPIISGVKNRKNVVLGKSLGIREVGIVLKIIAAMNANDYLKAYKIESVDVSNLSKIEIYLSNSLKIIMDKDKIVKKVNKLGILISQGNFDIKDINYVDLRFKEPILGKK